MQNVGFGRHGVLAALLLVLFLGLGSIAVLNFVFVQHTAESMAAVDAIGRQQAQPQVIVSSLQMLRSDLAGRRYLGRGVRELDVATGNFNAAMLQLEGSTAEAQRELLGFAPLAGERNQKSLEQLRQLWTEFRARLAPIIGYKSEAYVETAEQGTQLSSAGLTLNRALEEAAQYGLANQAAMSRSIDALVSNVKAASQARAANLRAASLIGLVICAAVLAFALVLLNGISRKERQVLRAKQESDDILRTVNQGLFLLDGDLKIGTERSEALENIFRRKDFDRLHFTDLLRGLVPEKTLETAAEYVRLLWGERVNEKLIKTINPLSEVEASFEAGQGKIDTQYLEFDFNRVRAEGGMSRILVTVNDVTRRVELARELQESQEKAQAQLDLLLHILHVNPLQLSAFLEESEVSMKMVNSILKEPAREAAAFRAKLDGMFRQVHGVKGEAAALGLKTIEQRAHGFEEALSELRKNDKLGGSDFLPLVVKLDDLFKHFAQVREMIGRLSDLRVAMSGDAAPAVPPAHEESAARLESAVAAEPGADGEDELTGPGGTLIQRPPEALEILRQNAEGGDLTATLTQLAQRIAHKQSKQVMMNCSGLERVPNKYRRSLKDIAIQMVRNSLAHGIETPQERTRQSKAAAGSIVVRFESHGTDGYEFICQDDGRGLSVPQLKSKAVERGIITAEQAAALDERGALSLIFMPGFSTQDEVTHDSGRGVGMDIVRAKVLEMGGKMGISTSAGKFLRFRIWLPADAEVRAA